jgi:hypothetical protein
MNGYAAWMGWQWHAKNTVLQEQLVPVPLYTAQIPPGQAWDWTQPVAYTGILFRGVQQIQLRTDGIENRNLGAVAPQSGVPLNFQMRENHILIRLLQVYFSWNWESGSALSKRKKFQGRVFNPPNAPPLYDTGLSPPAKVRGLQLTVSAMKRGAPACQGTLRRQKCNKT